MVVDGGIWQRQDGEDGEVTGEEVGEEAPEEKRRKGKNIISEEDCDFIPRMNGPCTTAKRLQNDCKQSLHGAYDPRRFTCINRCLRSCAWNPYVVRVRTIWPEFVYSACRAVKKPGPKDIGHRTALTMPNQKLNDGSMLGEMTDGRELKAPGLDPSRCIYHGNRTSGTRECEEVLRTPYRQPRWKLDTQRQGSRQS